MVTLMVVVVPTVAAVVVVVVMVLLTVWLMVAMICHQRLCCLWVDQPNQPAQDRRLEACVPFSMCGNGEFQCKCISQVA